LNGETHTPPSDVGARTGNGPKEIVVRDSTPPVGVTWSRPPSTATHIVPSPPAANAITADCGSNIVMVPLGARRVIPEPVPVNHTASSLATQKRDTLPSTAFASPLAVVRKRPSVVSNVIQNDPSFAAATMELDRMSGSVTTSVGPSSVRR